MQEIDFTLQNFTSFDVTKKTTIRLGHKAYRLGAAKLTCSKEQLELDTEVIEVRHLRFGDLGLPEAATDGFNTIKALREELEHCYLKSIPDCEPVTIVKFRI